MQNIGNSVGSAIEVALDQTGTMLPAGCTLRLVGFVTENILKGNLTVPATETQQGFIIVGPGTTKAGLKDLSLRECRAYRWVLNPVKMLGGQYSHGEHVWKRTYISGRCAMIRENMVDLVCPVCGRNKPKMWSDEVFRLSVDKDGNKARKRSGDSFVLCKSCTDDPKIDGKVAMNQTRRGVSMFPMDNPRIDAAFTGKDDPRLQAMVEAWMMPEPIYDDTLLPRVWAVYPVGQAPTDFVPQDPVAQAIEDRCAEYVIKKNHRSDPRTIRPLEHARKTQKEGVRSPLRTLVMEAADMRAGWIPEDLLFENDSAGFKRRFLSAYDNASI